ncbi:MAG: T9SS type A sorting domain-containing protein [Saprospiraceae bacterium]|nr:T9SS type A sorting domain-containing protein [Saprospiraceae bacterium]
MVPRNARLNIYGGVLVGSNQCLPAGDEPKPWGGIQVWGTQDQPHPTYAAVAGTGNAAYLNSNHGIVHFTWGTIKHVNDVFAGAGAIAAGPSYPFDQFLPSSGSSTWINHFGGIVITYGGIFEECRKGVELQAYPAPGQTNASICRFTDSYWTSCGEGIINAGAQGVSVYACTFEQDNPGATTRGIVDLNARMQIGGSLFKKLGHGVDVLSPTSLNMQVKIGDLTHSSQGNLFETCQLGVWAQGTDQLEIGNNYFTNPTNISGYAGVWLDGPNSYSIANNEFSDLWEGILMSNTQQPFASADLSCNLYEDTEFSLFSFGNNANLDFQSEDFDDSGEDLRYEGNSVTTGVIPHQGYGGNAVYNYFSPQIPLANFVSMGNTTTFNYYHPSGSVPAELIPHCAINDGCTTTTSNHYNLDGSYVEFSCPHEPNEQLLCETGGCLDTLRMQLDSLSALIDGGDTDGLLGLISSSPGSSSTVTALLGASPYLSDDVLIAVIEAAGMAEADKRTILVANALLQKKVVEAAIEEELSEATLVAIDTVSSASGRSLLEQEIRKVSQAYWAGLRSMILANGVDSAGYATSVTLVADQDHPEAERQLYEWQVDLGKWTDAQSTLDSLPAGWQAWKDLQQLHLDKLQSFGDTLTLAQESLLDSIALEHSANGSVARSLLALWQSEMFYPFAPQSLPSEKTIRPITGGLTNAGLNVYPNPGNGEFILTTHSINGDPGGSITVLDLGGTPVWQQAGLQPKQVLDLQTLPSGMYFVRILSRDEQATLKLVIK